jgi:hypothetical protein
MATISSNKKLNSANKAKKDEFYTQLADIENELKHYKSQFRNKVVYCNCDDPFESNFFKYFAANFNALKIKKLITTSYVKSPIVGEQLSLFDIEGLKPEGKEPIIIEINEVKDLDSDGAIGLKDIELLLRHDANAAKPLKGNGDFRSDECIELLKLADIVVTNPPFSLFREYVAQLVEYDKSFLVIGNLNAITYKDCFELIKNNKMWLGLTMDGRNKWFRVPNSYPINDNVANSKIENGNKYLFVKGCLWFTNMDTKKRHEEMTLYKKYNLKDFPKYDNYDAIEVSKAVEIPMDYYGTIGVPITFLNKYNPDQFDIIGITDRDPENTCRTKMYTRKDSPKYNDLNRRAAIRANNTLIPVYARLLIRRKKVK